MLVFLHQLRTNRVLPASFPWYSGYKVCLFLWERLICSFSPLPKLTMHITMFARVTPIRKTASPENKVSETSKWAKSLLFVEEYIFKTTITKLPTMTSMKIWSSSSQQSAIKRPWLRKKDWEVSITITTISDFFFSIRQKRAAKIKIIIATGIITDCSINWWSFMSFIARRTWSCVPKIKKKSNFKRAMYTWIISQLGSLNHLRAG